MKKAHHYIGLVGWRSLSFSEYDRVYCDSLTLLFVAKCFGIKLDYLPGAKSLRALDAGSKKNVYLTPFPLSQFPENQQFELPKFDSVTNIPDQVQAWLEENANACKVYIGISTPNQNILGSLINQKYQLEVHCVGAALIEACSPSYRQVKLVSGHGFEWVYRGVKSPKRFFEKLGQILVAIIGLAANKSQRSEFKKVFNKARFHLSGKSG